MISSSKVSHEPETFHLIICHKSQERYMNIFTDHSSGFQHSVIFVPLGYRFVVVYTREQTSCDYSDRNMIIYSSSSYSILVKQCQSKI